MFAIRDDRFVLPHSLLDMSFNFACREYVNQEDLTKAARKVSEAKKHESKPMRPFMYRTALKISPTAKMEYSA